jgi:serine-type D-Ala-D-Ala carboxypeptidase/endopeptidase
MTDARGGCGRYAIGCGCGVILGVALGALVAGGLAWNWIEDQQAQQNPLADLGIQEETLTRQEVEGYLKRLANEHLENDENIGLVIGILHDGQSEVFGFGRLSKSSKQQPDGSTLFELGSITKTFTALLLADMHRGGEVDWDDPVGKYLPEDVVIPGKPISLLDLATHSSGLPRLPPGLEESVRNPLNPYAAFDEQRLHADLPKVKLEQRRYAYSNLGMGLLGHLLARRAEKEYETLVVDRICKPLAMDDTQITLTDTQKSRLAIPHDNGQSVPVWDLASLQAAGGVLSTADDMLKFLRAHLADPESDLQKAMQDCITKRRPADRIHVSIGLGWHVISENALDIVTHNGATGGTSTYAAMVPSHDIAVIVLSNSSSSVDKLGRQIVYLLHRLP